MPTARCSSAHATTSNIGSLDTKFCQSQRVVALFSMYYTSILHRVLRGALDKRSFHVCHPLTSSLLSIHGQIISTMDYTYING